VYLCRVNHRNTYIAILLVFLYLFPIGYQTVHKVLHKGLSDCDNSCCTISYPEENQICHPESHSSAEQANGLRTQDGPWLSPEESSCPVCDYAFTLTTEPETMVDLQGLPIALAGISLYIPDVPFTFSGYCSFLRAPPVPDLLLA